MEKQLRWEAKFDTKFSDEIDFLDTILKSYGIEDTKLFLNPTKQSINDPFLMKNMEEAIKVFHECVEEDKINGKKIVIKCDSDADGYTSSSLLTAIIKYFNPTAKIEYLYSFEKEHGLTYKNLSKLPKDEVGLILIPDASMTCKEAIQITRNYSAPIIVLDHHIQEIEYLDTQTGRWITKEEADEISETNPDRIKEDIYTNYCIAVDNNDGQYPNGTLSGVGVVMKFAEGYCKYYNEDDMWLNNYLDLVSTGIVCDTMSLKNPETRYYVMERLKTENRHNDFLNELHTRLERDMHEERTITNVGWTMGPRINAVCRYGKEEEQIDMLRAFCGEQEDVVYQPRRKSKDDPKPPEELHTLQWEMARVADNVKSRQDSEVRKFMGEVDKKIEQNGLLKNSILFVDCTDIIDKKSVTGLCANKLKSKYMRPVVLMKSRSATEFGGSGRGYENGEVKNFNQFLSEVGVSCAGHAQAFRVNFKKADLQTIIDRCNEKLPLDHLYTVFPVDWVMDAKELKQSYIREVADNYKIWGNDVPTPTFAITNIHINASQINGYGETKSFIRFVSNGVTYVKKYCAASEYNYMTMRDRNVFGVNKKNLVLNIIAQFQNEEYDGKIYPQVKILEYDVKEDKDFVDEEIAVTPMVDKKVTKKSSETIDKDDDWDIIESNTSKNKKKIVLNDDDFVF